ncbi:hypothetical protein JTE90_027695 [Oedothorax gibbosus]|uniref:Uncharacterized protein n=1 Tax=Oedothorax gibbosus TaxID=931172 RepID=A0AAV6TCT2_9ARAC|nr:hypothetical protein JTE90_027695 [Oedothorax gibbosus]
MPTSMAYVRLSRATTPFMGSHERLAYGRLTGRLVHHTAPSLLPKVAPGHLILSRRPSQSCKADFSPFKVLRNRLSSFRPKASNLRFTDETEFHERQLS